MRHGLVSFVLICALSLAHTGLAEEPKYEFTKDWISEDAATWLKYLKRYKDKPNVKALEIGSYEGRSAIWFLENILTGKNSSIVCIDPWDREEIEGHFDRNIEASGHAQKVRKIKDYSQHAMMGMKRQQFDFIYIDGCHQASCILTDAVLGLQLTKYGGIIIFDDYGLGLEWEQFKRPIDAIDAFLHIYHNAIKVLERNRSLVVISRTPSWMQGEKEKKGKGVKKQKP